MRKVLAICLIALVAAAVPGCVLGARPVPSATAAPAAASAYPTPWPPATIGTITSSQVSVRDLRVSYNRDEASLQSENFSILLENSGRTWANNTFITLRVTDAFTDEFYYASQIDAGDIPPRSTRQLNFTSDLHAFGFSVLVRMEWFWGDDLEFHNTLEKAFTLAPVDWEHVNG